MLTIGAAWMLAARTEPVRPVWMVVLRLTDTIAATDETYSFATHPGFGVSGGLISVSPIAAAVDVLTRALKQSTYEIVLRRDALVRRMVTSHPLAGKKATIKLGFQGLAATDFISVATCTIMDAVTDETGLTLRCAPVGMRLRDNRGKFRITNEHPLQAIESLINNSGSIGTSQYDATTTDESADTEISHWNLSRQEQTGTSTYDPFGKQELAETDFRELVSGLLEVLDGVLLPNGNGVLAFHRHDPDAASVRTWERKDILDFRPVSQFDNLINEVVCRFARGSESFAFTLEDPASKERYAYPDEDELVKQHVIESNWLNGVGVLADPQPSDSNMLAPDDTSFRVALAGINGFCGARFTPGTSSQPTGAALGSGRVAYLMFTGTNKRISDVGGWSTYENDKPEIVRVKTIAFETVTGEPSFVVAPNGSRYPSFLRFTLDDTADNGGRCQFESGTPDIPGWLIGTVVADVTMLVDRGQRILDRFAEGCPIVEVHTNLREMEVDTLDAVQVVDDVYLDFDYDGADENTTWEVISKEVRAIDDSPRIVWTLARLRADSLATVTPGFNAELSGTVGLVSVSATHAMTFSDGGAVLSESGEPYFTRY